MIVRLSVCLLLLAAWTSGASPDPAVRPGEVALALSSTHASYLPIDLEATAEGICRGLRQIAPSALGECRLKVVTPTEAPHPPVRLGLAAREIPGVPGASGHSLFATGLALAADATVATSCGPWSASVVIDAGRLQPHASLVLSTAGGNPGGGAFASALPVHATLHLVNLYTGLAYDLPLTMGFDLAGSWTQASRGEATVLKETESDLIFFADREEGVLVDRTDCITVRLLASCLESAFSDDLVDCPVCFETGSPAKPGLSGPTN